MTLNQRITLKQPQWCMRGWDPGWWNGDNTFCDYSLIDYSCTELLITALQIPFGKDLWIQASIDPPASWWKLHPSVCILRAKPWGDRTNGDTLGVKRAQKLLSCVWLSKPLSLRALKEPPKWDDRHFRPVPPPQKKNSSKPMPKTAHQVLMRKHVQTYIQGEWVGKAAWSIKRTYVLSIQTREGTDLLWSAFLSCSSTSFSIGWSMN